MASSVGVSAAGISASGARQDWHSARPDGRNWEEPQIAPLRDSQEPILYFPLIHHLYFVFQTYKKFSSVAVATSRSCFRVARFSADRTFAIVSSSSDKGTFNAAPSFSW